MRSKKRSSPAGLAVINAIFHLATRALFEGTAPRWSGMQPKRYHGPRTTRWGRNPDTGRFEHTGHDRC